MIYSKIIGTGSYLPSLIVTNHDLSKIVDTTDSWILERTGIRERRRVTKGQTNTDIALKASLAALKSSGTNKDQIELIIYATLTPDTSMPTASCLLQQKLSASRAACFDLSAACTGFIYGLSIADQFIRSGMYKRILIVGSEVLSSITDYQDRTTCVLFGDGAGAVVLSDTTNKNDGYTLSTHLYADGSFSDLLSIPSSGCGNPVTKETIERRDVFVKMKGKELFKVAVKSLSQAAMDALNANNLTIDDLDLFIPHQANMRILEAVAKRLLLTQDKIFTNLEKYGNTSSASIPICLDEAIHQGRIKKGDTVLLDAFGGGLTYGSALIKW